MTSSRRRSERAAEHEYDAAMGVALDEARAALAHDDVPVGAVVVRRRRRRDRRAAAQRARASPATRPRTPRCSAIADAARSRDGWRLDDCALVVTLEPCPMCAGAASAARIPLVVFGAADPKAGAAGSLYNFAADPRLNHEHRRCIAGVRADECGGAAQRVLRERAALTASRNIPPGGMRERPNRMVSKTIVAQVTVGSNPTPSATVASGPGRCLARSRG